MIQISGSRSPRQAARLCGNREKRARTEDRNDDLPSNAALELLGRLRDQGGRIRFHGDFDWGGIKIGN